MSRRTLAMLLVALSSVAGCSRAPARDDEMGRWFGHPASELVKLWGQPQSIVELEEHRLEYKYPRPDIDASCIHFWVMNRQGFIIAHRHEGNCRP